MRKKKILENIGLWVLLYVVWVAIFQNRALTITRTITIQFCYLLFIAANYYLHVYVTIPRYLYKKKYVLFAIVLLVGITAGAILRVPLAIYISGRFFGVTARPDVYGLFINSFVNIFIWVICLLAAKITIDKIRFQKYVDAMEKEKAKTELDFLRAQFNPHFLFNSINSIYGHIDKKNPVARSMLLTFSDMLRYQLYECNTETISIDKEMAYIKNYVRLQQARMEEDLIVNVQIADNIQGFTIAPLLCMAFIENAFKYVSTSDDGRENRVDILFDKPGSELLCRVYNTVDAIRSTNPAHSGIGIANARRRLALLYPGRHSLQLNETTAAYEVILKLQVQ